MNLSNSDTRRADQPSARREARREQKRQSRSRTRKRGGWRNLFGKMHLYLSLPFGIIFTVMSLTGALLVFEPEIDRLARPELYEVADTTGGRLPLDEVAEIVAKTLPDDTKVVGITVDAAPESTVKVLLSQPRHAAVAVNPYTGEIIGRTDRTPFFSTVFKLHRWLSGSPTAKDGSMGWGRMVTGISTIVFVVILLTGLAVWWPRNRKGLRGGLTFRRTKNRFGRYLQLHRVLGAYTLVFLLVMALTGLMWSFKWYNSAVYALLGAKQEKREAKAREPQAKAETHDPSRRETDGLGRAATPHADSNAAKPDNPTEAALTHSPTAATAGTGTKGTGETADFACWQQMAERLSHEHPDFQTLTVRDGKATVSVAAYGNSRAAHSYEFDPATGRVTQSTPYAEAKKASKIRGWQYSLHVGTWGGLATRVLYCLAALLGATLPLTGYYLWWKKRRRRTAATARGAHGCA